MMKKIFFFIVFITFVFLLIPVVNAADGFNNVSELIFCDRLEIKRAFKVGGILIYIMKVLAPLIIIIMGAIDFGKALVSGDEKDISISTQKLFKRFIAGVIIFFIPTIISVILNMVDGVSETQSKFSNCHNCLLQPFSGACE